jgi:hypothetical protein
LSTVAYAIRKTVDADSFAGSVSLPDGVLFNVGEAFESSAHSNDDGKVYVTSDVHEIAALDAYPPLKHVAVPESAQDLIVAAPRVDPALAGTSGEANEGVAPQSAPTDSGEAPASDESEGEDEAPSGASEAEDATGDAPADIAPLDLGPLGTRGLFTRGANANGGE